MRNSRLTSDFISTAPLLRVIGKHGAGLDNIDIAAAEAAGIAVRSAPGANSEAVADLAVGMALALVRRLVQHTVALAEGRCLTGPQMRGYDLGELEAGIVGVGAIGSRVARRLVDGFGAPVFGYDPYVPSERWPATVKALPSLVALLESARIVFLHCPLTDETRKMIDGAAIERMVPGAFLVNCARGGVLDEEAAADGLRRGQLGGVAADVFISEPRFESPLLAAPNVVATPHTGAQTERSLRNVGLTIADKVLACLC